MSDINWAEKRDALRQRTLKHGRVVVKGMSTMDCLIRNMSLTGARIAVPNPLALPDHFTLLIGTEGLKRDCEVMSRSETSAGLRFEKPLLPRELGAEFMSLKGSDTGVVRAPATAPKPKVRERLSYQDLTGDELQKGESTLRTKPVRTSTVAPSLEGGDNGDRNDEARQAEPSSKVESVTVSDRNVGIRRIVAGELPEALTQRLPW